MCRRWKATAAMPIILIRKTGWKWREDYFDPEMPTAVELHFAFWNERAECSNDGFLVPLTGFQRGGEYAAHQAHGQSSENGQTALHSCFSSNNAHNVATIDKFHDSAVSCVMYKLFDQNARGETSAPGVLDSW